MRPSPNVTFIVTPVPFQMSLGIWNVAVEPLTVMSPSVEPYSLGLYDSFAPVTILPASGAKFSVTLAPSSTDVVNGLPAVAV
ncbi:MULTISPECIES: hypothetical protein [Prevotellaceae]|uniref:hypothetical protein n=1 Tax=Prevotellaceae TaxID=171552 RepID=UPI00115FB2D4|nr:MULTISPECIES: hypothetical protein [Prevotellaceae]QVJ80087.1 hypothetical protein J4031_10340 [Xylanibacter ruminicola]